MKASVSTCVAAIAFAGASPAPAIAQEPSSVTAPSEEQNRAFIAEAFARWAAGDGDVFSLLADDVVWHIAGNDPAVAQTHRSRQALLDAAAVPLRDRLAAPLRP